MARHVMGLVLASAVLALPAQATASQRLVVVPFENATGEASLYWIGEAFAVGLTDQLLAAGHDAVEPRRRREAALEMGLPLDEPVTTASSLLLARRVHAGAAVTGTVALRESNRVVVNARLVRTEGSGTEPVKVDGALHELHALQERLARRLLPPGPSARAEGLTPRQVLEQVPLGSFELYIKAVMTADPDERRSLLDRALEADPLYPAALLERARMELEEGRASDALIWLERVQVEAMAFPERYWLLRADVAAANGDHGSAIDLYARALAIRPLPTAHFRKGAAMARQGRLMEARREVDTGLALDPGDPEGVELREALGRHGTEPAP